MTDSNASDPGLPTAQNTRREVLQGMGGALLFVLTARGNQAQIYAAAMAGRDLFFKLNELEGKTLEALGDTLLPGAAHAGIAYYVNRQLASDTPLLMLKYLDYQGTFLDFYQKGLASLEALSLRRHNGSFFDLTSPQQTDLVCEISQNNPAGWSGPPSPLFYFATRNDAVDVYDGTPEGYEKLDIPYMAHITPQQNW